MKENKKVKEIHKQRHIFLHKCLDELFADFITNANGSTSNSILSLTEWSHKQIEEPDHNYKSSL